MICHHYKCIFVHIPKNAGQSIENVFLDLVGLNWKNRAPLLLRSNRNPDLGPPRLAHLKAEEYVHFKYLSKDIFDDYFKFSFVRNPWSRMVSFYKYLGFEDKFEFKDFLFRKFESEIYHKMYWFVGPQKDFIYNQKNERIVDFVGRFEHLQADFDEICRRINVSPIVLPHANKSDEKKSESVEASRVSSWKDHYDQDCIDLVARLYERDICEFGYEF